MAIPADNTSMAVFCDFENVALGVRDAKYEKFDIKLVLERLLLKGSIVVKKAYCDWERYKGFKSTMHEANFELIEIPHLRMSGKNSADIRLVVDALDLCYTKAHVNTFVIISGDSDFSPLVSKLRENAKQVIGVGVKQSTSDLLIANCDEFIFYDDLVRETRRQNAKRDAKSGQDSQPAERRGDDDKRRETHDQRRSQAIELVLETLEALIDERGDSGKIWASVLKQAIKRRKPDFNESYYGFRSFGSLIEEAQKRGLLEFGRDDKNGAYVMRRHSDPAAAPDQGSPGAVAAASESSAATVAPPTEGQAQLPSQAPPSSSAPGEAPASAHSLPGSPAASAAENQSVSKAARKPARQLARERKSAKPVDSPPSPAGISADTTSQMAAVEPMPASTPLLAPVPQATDAPATDAPASPSGQRRGRARSKAQVTASHAQETPTPARPPSDQATPHNPAPATPATPAAPATPAPRRRRPAAKTAAKPPQEAS